METALASSFFFPLLLFFFFCQTHTTWFWKFPTGHGRVLQLDRFGSPTGSHYSQLFGPPHHAPPRPAREREKMEMDTPNQGDILCPCALRWWVHVACCQGVGSQCIDKLASLVDRTCRVLIPADPGPAHSLWLLLCKCKATQHLWICDASTIQPILSRASSDL